MIYAVLLSNVIQIHAHFTVGTTETAVQVHTVVRGQPGSNPFPGAFSSHGGARREASPPAGPPWASGGGHGFYRDDFQGLGTSWAVLGLRGGQDSLPVLLRVVSQKVSHRFLLQEPMRGVCGPRGDQARPLLRRSGESVILGGLCHQGLQNSGLGERDPSHPSLSL